MSLQRGRPHRQTQTRRHRSRRLLRCHCIGDGLPADHQSCWGAA